MLQFKIRTIGIGLALISIGLAATLHVQRWRKIKDADEKLHAAFCIIHFDVRDRIDCDDGYSEPGLNCLRPLPFQPVEDSHVERYFTGILTQPEISRHLVINDQIDVRSIATCNLGYFARPVVTLYDCNATENKWFIEHLSKAAEHVHLRVRNGG